VGAAAGSSPGAAVVPRSPGAFSMRLPVSRVLSVCLALLVAGLASSVGAAPTPVKIEVPILRAIQLNMMPKEGAEGEDDVYVLVNGVAKGQEFQKRLPESGTTKVAPKKPMFSDKPAVLWEGELNDGEFAYVTVVVMQGEGRDAAKVKEFQGKLADAAKKVSERSKKTINSDESDKIVEGTVKAQREVISKVKETFSRDKKTDHYGGLFNVLVWNNGGKITKRLDPVGLTFGEHFGIDAKIYTKLKYTRPNVLEKDKAGDFNEVQLPPVDDDKPEVVRVKMLETEYVKQGDQALRKVTDYLADVRITAGGKVLEWELGGEQTGPGTLHTYWEYAE
jgi:hypothetical protein